VLFRSDPAVAIALRDNSGVGVGGSVSQNEVSTTPSTFVNVGEETSKGFDINTRVSTQLGGFDVQWNGAATIQTERAEQIFADDPVDDLVGDFGTPEHRFVSTLAVAQGPWEGVWNMRWFSDTSPSADVLDRLNDQCLSSDNPASATTTSYPGSPLVYLVCDAEGPTYHDLSLTFRGDSFSLTGGINNVFDEQPALVSAGVGSNRGNRMTSSGYDQIGRTLFVGVRKSF